MLFKGLVVFSRLETSNPFTVLLSVTGPHLLHAVQGRLLSFSILSLMFQILFSVSLPRWWVHGSPRSTVGSRRRTMLIIFGTDFSWLLAGPVVVALSGPGFCGNSLG